MSDNTDRDADISDSVPRPDPTRLTTQLVDRALAAYREVVETRLYAMDKAIALANENMAMTRAHADTGITHFRDDRDRELFAQREILTAAIDKIAAVADEKFTAVDTRFLERDTRTEQAAQESRISLDAALAAAKEAVSEQNKANTEAIRKSELATQKQIDSLVALMNTANKSLEDKFGDVKSRIDRIDGEAHGSADTKSERRLDMGQIIFAVSVLLSAVAIVIGLVVTKI